LNQNVIIRCFKPEDMESVVEMLQSVSIFRPNDVKLSGLAESFLRVEGNHAFIAECNGQVIGFGSVLMIERIRGGRAAIIEDVVVCKDARGKGIGSLIVSSLISFAKDTGCFKVTLVASDDNIKFYERCGFEKYFQSMRLSL